MDPAQTSQKGQKKEDYGRRAALIVSLVLHALAIGGFIWAGHDAKKQARKPFQSVTVKLGGPKNLKLGGKKTKAPVAGKKASKPKKKSTSKKSRPKNKKDIGLNRKVKPKKKASSKSNSGKKKSKPAKKAAPDPPKPTPVDKSKDQKARGGIDGTEGSGVSLEVGDGSKEVSTDRQFIYYYKLVMAEIGRRWVKVGLLKGLARVQFAINPDGSVGNARIIQSSGSSLLDRPALQAVLSSEFPPLPQGFKEEKMEIIINFDYGGDN